MKTATFAASTRVDRSTNRLKWECRFVTLPHAILTHPSFQELSGGSVKLLLAILSGYVGTNNGQLTATAGRMKYSGFNSKESIARGLRELIAQGFIIRTRAQHLRSPALYAITWLPVSQPMPGENYDSGIFPTEESTDAWRGPHAQVGAA